MKVLFLDIDGVLNSHQSFNFWYNKRDQGKWENEMYANWKGSLQEYLAQEFCPIAMSNMEELLRRFPELKIVVSSTWRLSNTMDTMKDIFKPSKLICDALFGMTPAFIDEPRGEEIASWLKYHPGVTQYVIVDDNSDMLDSQKDNFVHTSALHGFQWGDMLWAERILKKT